MITQYSNLSRSPCKASCPMKESTAPPSLESSMDLLTIRSTSVSRSLMQTSNQLAVELCPEERHQPDLAPFTTTLRALPFIHFFTQWTMNLGLEGVRVFSSPFLFYFFASQSVAKSLLDKWNETFDRFNSFGKFCLYFWFLLHQNFVCICISNCSNSMEEINMGSQLHKLQTCIWKPARRLISAAA